VRVSAALTRYRVLAYIVGVGLLLLVLVAMPLKYFADSPGMVAVVGTLHGFLFLVYVLTALDLAVRARFSPVWTVAVLVAGTIPFLSFVAERRVTRDVRAQLNRTTRVA
jgi:integral membrane protein